MQGSQCACCGAPTKRFVSSGRWQKYCSRACYDKAHQVKRRIQMRCAHCDVEFMGLVSTKAGRSENRFCTLSCASRYRIAHGYKPHLALPRKPKREPLTGPLYGNVRMRSCTHCRQMYPGTEGRMYCSKACSIGAATYRRAKASPAVRCLHCGLMYSCLWGRFGVTGGTHTCSNECQVANARLTVHSAKRSRRVKIRGGRVDHVSTRSIFERDGWRCQACGCDTPASLRGTQDDNAPELDHIVPVCVGGSHTADNLQCLCRVCNILKGSMSMPEFLHEYHGDRGGSLATSRTRAPAQFFR